MINVENDKEPQNIQGVNTNNPVNSSPDTVYTSPEDTGSTPKKNNIKNLLLPIVAILIITASGLLLRNIIFKNDEITPINTDEQRAINVSSQPAKQFTSETPVPRTPDTLKIESKGVIDMDYSVSGRLLSAYEAGDKVVSKFEFKNNSQSSQKVFYFMIDLDSFSAYDESKHKFISSGAEPFDGETVLSPGEIKEVELSFKTVPKPYIWFYRGLNKRVTFGSYDPTK